MVLKGCWIMEPGPVILESHGVKGCWTEKGVGVCLRCHTSLIFHIVYFAVGGDVWLQKCMWIFGSADTRAAASLFGPLVRGPRGS